MAVLHMYLYFTFVTLSSYKSAKIAELAHIRMDFGGIMQSV